MEKRNYTLETARCPKCNAICINGHDDDGHIYCAKCKHTFLPKQLTKITDEEYKALQEKVSSEGERYECSGWTAFAIPIK